MLHRIRRHPATLLVVVALLAVWVIAIPTGPRGPFSPPAAGLNPDALEDHHWWTILTSMLVAGGVAQFAISMVAAIVGVGLAERWMGSWRTLVAFVATGVVAGALGLGLELLGAAVHEFWSSSVRGLLTVDPLTPILGTLAWASAWAAPSSVGAPAPSSWASRRPCCCTPASRPTSTCSSPSVWGSDPALCCAGIDGRAGRPPGTRRAACSPSSPCCSRSVPSSRPSRSDATVCSRRSASP
ncbi:hypothetical protein GCM10025881_04340 [Pseudolysinimonas kribbensis]|uniref:Peptidase S54 rhomboid domain-containing protein n=1 Tax=Pseudolysinimonas kribbensis TaxID=433641 RepID=A0ABQ6K3F2_9MICO|nr:hypothetical protein GCM10025881_04340 [Pseudolysinimonas kribbensis]